jgi:hypothetical protein
MPRRSLPSNFPEGDRLKVNTLEWDHQNKRSKRPKRQLQITALKSSQQLKQRETKYKYSEKDNTGLRSVESLPEEEGDRYTAGEKYKSEFPYLKR